MTKITVTAIPPAMNANSERSAHFGPVNEPRQRHDGFPLRSLTHWPEFSQKPSHKSVKKI
jgi:hypothetical protein